jgi:hypothetical protein
VSRIIDLRSADEIARAPNPFAAEEVYRHLPFIDEQADLRRDPVAEATLIGTYRASIERNRSFIGAGIAALIDAPPGGVLVHCAAGKDRTGVLVALVLRAVGVPVEQVVEDYTITAEMMKQRFADELARAETPEHRTMLVELQSARAETILDLLDFVDERYGSTTRYLAGLGVTAARLAALSDRLLS